MQETRAASAAWASRKGKKWIALTPLDSIYLRPPFLRELEGQLAQAPTTLIVARWVRIAYTNGWSHFDAHRLVGKKPLAVFWL